MATYTYNGDQELVLPTLGLTVKKGDTFEGPEGLNIAGVSKATTPKKETVSAVAEKEAKA